MILKITAPNADFAIWPPPVRRLNPNASPQCKEFLSSQRESAALGPASTLSETRGTATEVASYGAMSDTFERLKVAYRLRS